MPSYLGQAPGLGRQEFFHFTATASQTTFTGTDDNGFALSYTPGQVVVFLDGVMQDPADYTATNGTSVVLAAGASAGQLLSVVAFGAWSPADAVSLSGGTMVGNLNVPSINSGPLAGFRNLIMNGNFQVTQREYNGTANGYVLDRWRKTSAGAAAVTQGRAGVGVPSGTNGAHNYAFQATVSTADATVDAGDYMMFYQGIEGDNLEGLGFGTANAKQLTLSFWVKSSVTGTYCVSFMNSSGARSYVSEYTISAADTWEYKTITFTADTTGTWSNGTNAGLFVRFCLQGGSTYQGTAGTWQAGNFLCTSNQVNFTGSLSEVFEITGIQLEPGPVATPFERRSFGTELALCERYYQIVAVGIRTAYVQASGKQGSQINYGTKMRANPTIVSSIVETASSGNWGSTIEVVNKTTKGLIGSLIWNGSSGGGQQHWSGRVELDADF